jgi:hypothetical protein
MKAGAEETPEKLEFRGTLPPARCFVCRHASSLPGFWSVATCNMGTIFVLPFEKRRHNPGFCRRQSLSWEGGSSCDTLHLVHFLIIRDDDYSLGSCILCSLTLHVLVYAQSWAKWRGRATCGMGMSLRSPWPPTIGGNS